MMRRFLPFIFACSLCMVAVTLYFVSFHHEEDPILEHIRLENVRKAVEMTSLEIVDDFYFCDTIHGKGKIQITTIKAVISFDIDEPVRRGDTLVFDLSRPVINIYSRPDGIGINSVYGSTLTDSEEIVFQRHRADAIRRSVSHEHIVRAQQQAMQNLSKLFEAMHLNARITYSDAPTAHILPQVQLH